MSSILGKNIKVSIFGESHGKAIGCTIDSLPHGETIDMEALEKFMARRKTGKNEFSTARNEQDEVQILSGLVDGKTTASPLTAVIYNNDQRSHDYEKLKNIPRPSHADFTAYEKWQGFSDMRGGGHFSGRLTAPLCIAGGMAKQILERRGIFVSAHIRQILDIKDDKFPLNPSVSDLKAIETKDFPVINDKALAKMQEKIMAAKIDGDSVGAIIEAVAIGLPTGLGEPMFEGVENRLAQGIFGIPAVKGLEFGSGFSGALTYGSENNDEFIIDDDGNIKTKTNNSGGILGGITNSMPLTMNIAIKPTASIAKTQNSVNLLSLEKVQMNIKGRHDPCIAFRAVPVIEAVIAIIILDMMEDK